MVHMNVYLVYWVHSGQLSQSSHTKHLHNQVSPEQMREHLKHLELSMTHPCLSQQPSKRRVCWEKYGIVGTWSLFHLETKNGILEAVQNALKILA